MSAPKMTRAHFRFIAETIAAMPTFSPRLQTSQRECAFRFAEALALTNPAFNREKFLDAAIPDSLNDPESV